MNTDYTIAQQHLELINNPKLVRRGVQIEDEIPDKSLLFIGINPSFNEKNDLIPGVKGYSPIYSLKNINHSYFTKAAEIAKKNALPFGHHDLFPVRERDQKVIEGFFVDIDGRLLPSDGQAPFIENSLRWSEETILASCPQMIVVINAFASRIFFDYRFPNGQSLLGFKPGDKQLWVPELGTDFIWIDGQTVPILFSGMLSGQRALDRWSEFRLEWHIHHVLSNKELWPR